MNQTSTPKLERVSTTALVAVVALVVLSCGTSQPRISSVPEPPLDAWRYAIVIDASSSASTLQVFEWRQVAGESLPEIKAAPRSRGENRTSIWEMRVKPGIGSYGDRPDEAAASLAPLIDFALDKLDGDPRTLERTSVLLRATAGVRLLEPEQQRRILAGISDYLESTPFGETSARVLTGAEEGLFGWLSVNYLLGHLQHGGSFPTVGALDLGGASTQITFQPIDHPEQNTVTVQLGSNTYRVYTKSYLGLGQDEARSAVASATCYPVGYPSPAGPGTGDFDACRSAIRNRLAKPCSEDSRPCSMFGEYQPPLYGDFLALSAYAYIADFFEQRQLLRPDELAVAGRRYCARDWQAWLSEEPEIASDPYLPTYCYGAAHVVTLLTDGLGFAADTERIAAPFKIQGTAVGWTLGALLFDLSAAGESRAAF